EWAETGGGPSLVGRWTLSAFGEYVSREVGSGHTLVVRDYARELPDDAPAFAALNIRATVCASAIRGGRLKAMLALHNAAPRDWKDDEIDLVQLVAHRCWEAIEPAPR